MRAQEEGAECSSAACSSVFTLGRTPRSLASVARGTGSLYPLGYPRGCTHWGTLEAGTRRSWQVTPLQHPALSPPMTNGRAVRGLLEPHSDVGWVPSPGSQSCLCRKLSRGPWARSCLALSLSFLLLKNKRSDMVFNSRLWGVSKKKNEIITGSCWMHMSSKHCL